ncbi:MAG: hypothetical protein K9W42_05265 [Candidatus Heimdallarchaeota archaeon]|nr:hypothetical protein [Candidatus Heimdallarchaeota archaeon]
MFFSEKIFLDLNSFKEMSEQYYGMIVYIAILTIAIVIFFVASIRIIINSQKQKSFYSLILIFVAPIVINIAYLFDKMEIGIKLFVLSSQESIIISTVGYSIAAIAINIFILRIINFRENIKRIIVILAILESIVMIGLDIALIIANAMGISLDIFNILTAFGGLLAIAVISFTIIVLFRESNIIASKMVRLRLRLAAVATLFALIDGLANALSIVFDVAGFLTFKEMYNIYPVPTIALIGYVIFSLGYYYALFTPFWLQKLTGIIPPSFLKLVQKEEQLRKSMEVQT